MKNLKPTIFRVVAVVAGLPATLYGVAAMWEPASISAVADTLSQATTAMSPDAAYLAHPLGLYIAMVGGLILASAIWPHRLLWVPKWAALLFVARGLQRAWYTVRLQELFAIEPSTNAVHCVYLIALGTALWYVSRWAPSVPAKRAVRIANTKVLTDRSPIPYLPKHDAAPLHSMVPENSHAA